MEGEDEDGIARGTAGRREAQPFRCPRAAPARIMPRCSRIGVGRRGQGGGGERRGKPPLGKLGGTDNSVAAAGRCATETGRDSGRGSIPRGTTETMQEPRTAPPPSSGLEAAGGGLKLELGFELGPLSNGYNDARRRAAR